MEGKIEKIEQELEKYAKESKLELIDVEYVHEGGYNYLRVYIEKEDGTISLDDCAKFSTEIDSIVDEQIDEKFFLEVSTPGIERRLKKEKDFLRFVGKDIKLYSKTQIDSKKVFEGKLVEFKENEKMICINDDKLNKIIEIPLEKLKKANIIYKMPNGILNSEEE